MYFNISPCVLDVRKIISSVVENLERDRQYGGNKRFIYVEMAFLKLWWLEQDDKVRNTVKNLVNEGILTSFCVSTHTN